MKPEDQPRRGRQGVQGIQGERGLPGKASSRVSWRDAWMVILTAILLVVAGQVIATADQVSAGLRSQTANRTKNVGVWCGAINQGRNYDRAFVARVTRGQIVYTLGTLPCLQLEKATAASTKAQSKK